MSTIGGRQQAALLAAVR